MYNRLKSNSASDVGCRAMGSSTGGCIQFLTSASTRSSKATAPRRWVISASRR
jgi:hypothetical protein